MAAEEAIPPDDPGAAPIAQLKTVGMPYVNPNIFELENKPKAVLAHDFGAGSPCLKCKDKCPKGLDLHFWRKICRTCKCRKEEHDVPLGDIDPGKLRIGRLFDQPPRAPVDDAAYSFIRPPADSAAAAAAPSTERYDWVPPGSTADLVSKYMGLLPSEERPIAGTQGADKRRRALEYQLPMHDVDPASCQGLTDAEKQQLQAFMDTVKKDVVGMGRVKEIKEDRETVADCAVNQNCETCAVKMRHGDVGLFAEHGRAESVWHPNCFRCETCKELMVDMLYFYRDGKYYCGRHFHDTMHPRCAGCDELIFAEKYTRAEEKDWHLKHFCCFGCDLELGGYRYMVRDDNPYCLECYLSNFARVCQKCKEKIGPDVQRISHKEMHWHAASSCFHCYQCETPLLGKRFVIKNSDIFCNTECKRVFAEMSR